MIQAESKTAFDNLDALLEVEGVNGIFIGQADLSASLGYPDNAAHPEVQKVIEHSIKRIRRAGKAAGFLAVNLEMAERAISWGANFVAVGVDTMLYTEALDNRLAHFKKRLIAPNKSSY